MKMEILVSWHEGNNVSQVAREPGTNTNYTSTISQSLYGELFW